MHFPYGTRTLATRQVLLVASDKREGKEHEGSAGVVGSLATHPMRVSILEQLLGTMWLIVCGEEGASVRRARHAIPCTPPPPLSHAPFASHSGAVGSLTCSLTCCSANGSF